MQQMPPARVSLHMKRIAVVVALAAIAGAIWYLQRPAPSTASNAPPPPPAAPRAQRITKVTKLDGKEHRAKLAEQIAANQAARAAAASSRTGATHAPKPPSLPSSERVSGSDTETLRVEIRSAMRGVIEEVRACYEAEMHALPANTKIVAELTLTGDPDVGTLIDARQIADDTGQPLSAKFDDCLRSTFQSLALPPLVEGDRVEVRYPFLFSKQ